MYRHSGRIQSGVSLLELLIWLAIVSVLLMVAIPTYGDMVIVNRLNSVTSELHGALLYTRSEAIKLGGNVVICRSATTLSENPTCDQGTAGNGAGWGDGWMIFHDLDRNKKYSNGDVILRMQGKLFRDRAEGAIIPSPAHNQLSFNATGQTFGNYMRFNIKRPLNDDDASHDRFLCLASGGRARVSRDACR